MHTHFIYCLHETPFRGEGNRYFYCYQITNLLNGKIYIGVHSTKNLEDCYMGSGRALHDAYKKYGIKNFRKDILKFFENDNQLYEYETKIVSEEFVDREDTYNMTTGGKGGQSGRYNSFYGKHHSEKTKERLRNLHIGMKASEETRKKLSIRSKNTPRTKEWNANISAAKKRNFHPYRGKPLNDILMKSVCYPIVIYNPVTMDILYEFEKIKDCVEFLNIRHALLKKIITNHIIYEGRYLIMYKDGRVPQKHSRPNCTGKKHPKHKTVYKFDIDGTFITKYDTITECLKENKLNRHTFLNNVNTEKPYKGYFYKFAEDINNE